MAMLTKAAWEVLKDEAAIYLQNAAQERNLFRGESEGEQQERVLLACADVLGALGSLPPKHKAEFEFAGDALWWMEKCLEETKGHLSYLDEHEEGGLSYVAKETYLARALQRVLDTQAVAA